jgi:hypothetical protein
VALAAGTGRAVGQQQRQGRVVGDGKGDPGSSSVTEAEEMVLGGRVQNPVAARLLESLLNYISVSYS